ncbi:MAG: hypothetical protein NTX79_00405 [Candidatus Micrarchaeota archaeon]|nr:hypothetical protein [Candidatus Micrarchaeota archaeon]
MATKFKFRYISVPKTALTSLGNPTEKHRLLEQRRKAKGDPYVVVKLPADLKQLGRELKQLKLSKALCKKIMRFAAADCKMREKIRKQRPIKTISDNFPNVWFGGGKGRKA